MQIISIDMRFYGNQQIEDRWSTSNLRNMPFNVFSEEWHIFCRSNERYYAVNQKIYQRAYFLDLFLNECMD